MMSASTGKRVRLAAAMLCGVSFLPFAAAAEVATVVVIDPGQVIGTSVSAVVPGDSTAGVVSLLNDSDSALVFESIGNDQLLDIATGASVAISLEVAGAQLFAAGRGNLESSQIGLLPAAPDGAATAGAGISQGLVLRNTSLFTVALDNLIGIAASVSLPAPLAVELSGNTVRTGAVYNSSLGTIELLPTLSLRAPDGPAAYNDSGTVLVELEATLSVATTQINEGHLAAPGQPQEPGLPAATALTAGNAISLEVTADADSFFTGIAAVEDNAITARATSNDTDGSILLRNEIVDADGTHVGPGVFGGTALVYALQNADDIADPDADFLGQGIVALNLENEISGVVSAGSSGLGGIDPESFAMALSGNELNATATINRARSEIGFEPALALAGSGSVLDQGAGEASVLLQERLGLRDALADYVIVARQSTNRREDVDPVVYALVVDGFVSADLATPAGSADLAVSGNGIGAVATGNFHDAMLHNRLDAAAGDTATFVNATAAMVNWQWVTAPEVEAGIEGTGTSITADLVLLDPLADQAAALTLEGNAVTARGQGNRGSAVLAFSAVDLSLALATDGPAGPVDNGAAALSSDRGATNAGDTFAATAGGTIVNYQILDSADSDHAESDYLVPGVRAEIRDSEIQGTLEAVGPRSADQALSLALAATGNGIEARALGNSFSATAQMQAEGIFTGSLGILGVQIDNDQSVSAQVLDSGLALNLDATTLDAADLAASVSVQGNVLLAVSGVNSAGHGIVVDANRLLAAGRNSATDAGDPSTTLGGLIEGYQFNAFRVTRHTSFANAAFAILNDQTVDEADAFSGLIGSGIVATVAGDPAAELENVALAVRQNTLAAQARLNDGANTIVLDIATLAELDPQEAPGPLAGIVSFQGSGQGYPDGPDEPDLAERDSLIQAIMEDSGILVEIPDLLHGGLTVAQNLLVATAAANVVENRIVISAVTLRAGLGEDANVAILDNDNATDFDLAVLGSVFVANSQRNESQLFGGGPGPAVVAYQGGEAGIRVVSSGEFELGIVEIVNNAIVAEARANVAQNVIELSAVSIEATAQVVSRQSNTGDVTATVENAPVMLELNSGAGVDASESSVVTVNGNAIESLALGNAVLNAISATAQGSFDNVGGNPPLINEELPATAGETEVSTDYAILNRQVNAGTEDRPLEVASSVVGSQIVVNLNGNHDATTVTVGSNGISAAAYGNIATNSVSLTAAGGTMPGSAIVNQQNNSFANISATVTGSGVVVNRNGVGPGASVMGGPNGVSATAVGNSATNTMVTRSGGPGPSN